MARICFWGLASSLLLGLVALAAPPLVVGEDAPRLPDAPIPKRRTGWVLANNTACYVCHENFKTETLVTQHAVKNVGCAECHGKSPDHCNDENNTTPPDIIFPRDKIDESCIKCHKTHNAPAIKVLARWLEKCPQKKDPATIICTDCHGEHRLRIRTVRWDKRTRKLIPREMP
jgi:hypothetical protein